VLLNTKHIQELITKGEIGQIKDALEQSLSPGSQSFEQALFGHIHSGKVSVDEAMANSDSPTNLHWLLNNAPKPQAGAAGTQSAATTRKTDDLTSIKLNLDALG
jgi:twitching motility protein PilU